MSSKSLVFLGMIVGSVLGSYIPTLFGIDGLSLTTLLTGSVGAILGIWIGYRLSNY